VSFGWYGLCQCCTIAAALTKPIPLKRFAQPDGSNLIRELGEVLCPLVSLLSWVMLVSQLVRLFRISLLRAR